MLHDRLGRTVRYVRLSVTDRCNLRCVYCRGGFERFIPHSDVLRYEEMLELIGLAASLGVEKLRLTGGEPFVRKHCIHFLESIRRAHPALDIRLTTNATLLEPYVQALADMGIGAVNVSLDTFRRERFTRITGRDMLPKVLHNIEALLAQGLRVKLNAVGMRGVNSDELPEFLAFARNNGVDVRFIEYMPMGQVAAGQPDSLWPAEAIEAEAAQLATLTPVPQHEAHAGPARLFTLDGGPGRLGLISAMSQHFCAHCNRLRITADGNLRTCLFSNAHSRLRPLLRHPALGLEAVRRVMVRSNMRKPLGHKLLGNAGAAVIEERMTAIGG